MRTRVTAERRVCIQDLMPADLFGSLWHQQGFLLGLLQIQVSLPSFFSV